MEAQGTAETVPMVEFADALGTKLARDEFTLQAVAAEEVICMHVQIEDCLYDCQ